MAAVVRTLLVLGRDRGGDRRPSSPPTRGSSRPRNPAASAMPATPSLIDRHSRDKAARLEFILIIRTNKGMKRSMI